MDSEVLTVKLLDLAEGRETPETWRNWWDEHEPELEALLNRGEFLKLKPCRHDFQWVPVLTSQKGAIAILEKSGTAFEASNLYHEQYLAELDAFCKEQERVQREKQKEFKAFSDTCTVRTRGSLMAVQQDRGSSPIELWDTGSGQLLATIDDPFVVRQVNFAFTKSGLVLHTDYGAMSIYSCAL